METFIEQNDRIEIHSTTCTPGWFHDRENEELYASFHAYNAEAWEPCNVIGDYDRSRDNNSNLE